MNVVPYNPGMQVSNLEALPMCKGARYLEVIVPHEPNLPLLAVAWIAVAWRRVKPRTLAKGRALIEFPARVS